MDEGCKVNLKINDSKLGRVHLVCLSTQKGCPSRVPDLDFYLMLLLF